MRELKIAERQDQAPNLSRTRYLTMAQFRREIIDWSDDTIRRRIRSDQLPAIHDGKAFMFDRSQVEAWFKRRIVR